MVGIITDIAMPSNTPLTLEEYDECFVKLSSYIEKNDLSKIKVLLLEDMRVFVWEQEMFSG